MNTLNTTLTLEYLLRSKTRTEILWELIRNFHQSYGIRELARRISKHPNAVLREIKFLRKSGIVDLKQTPAKHFYQINQKHPFFYELLSLFHKSYGLGGLILHNINLFESLDFVILTYFYIFQVPKEKYDIDLLLVGETNIEKTATLINSFESKLKKTITYSIISAAEFTKRKQMRDPFVLKILENPFVLLWGDRSKVLKTTT